MRVIALLLALATPAAAQGGFNGGVEIVDRRANKIVHCKSKTAIEFIAPMPTEEVPVFHPAAPESWHVILEIAAEQRVGSPKLKVAEGFYMPSPGLAAALPSDVNADTILGDPHPAIPGLTLTMDDDLIVNGTLLPAGTNLASFIEMIGSEIEHGGDQSISLTWIVDGQFTPVDINLDGGTNLFATIRGATDSVFVLHGFDPVYASCTGPTGLQSTPTVSIWAADWISTVDSDVLSSDGREAFLIGVEVRIPCWFNPATAPPTPTPFDPVPGPGFGGQVVTGNFPFIAGPGPHPMWPTVYLTFSDDYLDVATASFVAGGIISGGTCATIYGVTGPNLAFALEQASVSAWYGVDGVPTLVPIPADDQMIYRFTMLADGMIMDTDVLPMEMMVTATVETECNVFSITNVRVKHRPDINTPDPPP